MIHKKRVSVYIIGVIAFISACSESSKNIYSGENEDRFIIYTKLSKNINLSKNFNSPKAINKIAEIENEYFNNFEIKCSKYYGTQWANSADYYLNEEDSLTVFQQYKKIIEKRKEKPDSMHCTIYAITALKAGMDTNYYKLEKIHEKIWRKREYAGWSVAHILTKYFNWTAYAFVSTYSEEYKSCKRNFANNKSYNVWRQPNIKIKKLLNFDNDRNEIDSILKSHEFGFGFSTQGWHTWITRYDTLKECNWAGSPCEKYYDDKLFLKTKFTEYYDYASHVIVFPPNE